MASAHDLVQSKVMSRSKKRTYDSRKNRSAPPLATLPLAKPARRKKSPEIADFNKAFGERMRIARNKKDMTQIDMAVALRTTLDKVKKQELGETAFPIYLLPTLARVLDKSIEWLTTGR